MRARLCTHAREPTGRARRWSFDATTNLCTAFNPRLARGNYVHMAHTLSSDSQLSTRRASLPTRCRSTRLYRPRFHWPTSSGRKIERGHSGRGRGREERRSTYPPLFYRVVHAGTTYPPESKRELASSSTQASPSLLLFFLALRCFSCSTGIMV